MIPEKQILDELRRIREDNILHANTVPWTMPPYKHKENQKPVIDEFKESLLRFFVNNGISKELYLKTNDILLTEAIKYERDEKEKLERDHMLVASDLLCISERHSKSEMNPIDRLITDTRVWRRIMNNEPHGIVDIIKTIANSDTKRRMYKSFRSEYLNSVEEALLSESNNALYNAFGPGGYDISL